MKDNLLIHPAEIKRRNRINLIMRMIDQILTEDKIEPQTWEEWLEAREEEDNDWTTERSDYRQVLREDYKPEVPCLANSDSLIGFYFKLRSR